MPPKRSRPSTSRAPPEPEAISIASTDSSHSRSSSVVVTGSQVALNRQRPAEHRIRGGTTRRSARRRAVSQERNDPIPAIFREMLEEDERRGWKSGTSSTAGSERGNVKRRKTRTQVDGGEGSVSRRDKGKTREIVESEDETVGETDSVAVSTPSNSIVIPDDGDDEDSDEEESEVDWEDVELGALPLGAQITSAREHSPSEPANLELVLDDPKTRKAAAPRRQITAVERRIRLETHKLHLICLIYHIHLRNVWCNNTTVKENLRPILPQKAYDKLYHDPSDQQFRRHKLFLEGLALAGDTFKKKFQITMKGMSAPHWQDPETWNTWTPPPGTELISKEDFIKSSKTLVGSRDLGAQLFCALLRSAGVTTRIVCSLQVLPFTITPKSGPQPQQPIVVSSDTENYPSPAPPRRTGGLRRPHLSHPSSTAVPNPSPKPKPSRTVEFAESAYPVYWIEAWSISTQKWVAVDPLVTHTVGKPSALSPPLSDPNNTLTYVLGVEDTTHVADVTVRYAKFFSAKTRRHRVTATKGGYKWYQKLLSHFSRGFDLDRDQLETAELAQKELAEPVPNNVQDLKDHPLFALKRHLKRGEIIHPERKAGTIITGSGKKKKSEVIYRRADVKEVKTAEQWYKMGRNVKEEEVPMKFTAIRKGRRGLEAGEEEPAHQPMFMFSQTEVYVPPPVEFGIVPKNKFGNLDVFVPSMVPKGGVHIPEKEATKAARLLGVSFAEVVTGFEFRNRQVNAVIRGVVVAEEYKDAVEAVIRGFEEERERDAELRRIVEALGRWRRWVTRLRIRERLGMEIAGRNENDELREKEEEEKYGVSNEAEDLGLGGFMLEYYGAAGGFIASDNAAGGGFIASDDAAGGGFIACDDAAGGGFITSDDAASGGFIVEEEQDTVIELPDANIRSPCRYEGEPDLSGGFIAKYEGIGKLGDRTAEPGETSKEDTTIADSPPKKFSLPPTSPLVERGNTDEELLSEDPDMDNEDLDWFQ